VLQVVRHMRGLHWTGEREYVVGFGSAPLGGAAVAAASGGGVQQWNPGYVENIIIGSGQECHLALPDPSLSRRHSCLSYDGRDFRIEDLYSSAGTYVRAVTPVPLQHGRTEHFKIGRTTLTVEVLSDAPLLSASDTARKAGATNSRSGRGNMPFAGWTRGGSRRTSQVSPTNARAMSSGGPTIHSAQSSTAFSFGLVSTSSLVPSAQASDRVVMAGHPAQSAVTAGGSSFLTLGNSMASQPSIVTYQGSTTTGTGQTQADGRSFTVAHSSSLADVTEHG